MKRARLSAIIFVISLTLVVWLFTARTRATTYTVTTTADSGVGSLRQAILDANAHAGTDTISFNIPGSGVQTIAPTSALPVITDSVIIDGTTQPGFAGSPIIELNGTNAGASADGLIIIAGSSTIRGLVINGFRGSGILIQINGSNLIEGNHFGSSISNNNGISITESPSSRIGGTNLSARNLFLNNTVGILISGSNSVGNVVEGNYLGVDSTGLPSSFTGIRIKLLDAYNTVIGGTNSGAGNVISNGDIGVSIYGGQFNVIQGNYIGTDITGTLAFGNGTGIFINLSGNNIIGGTTPSARNIISSNDNGMIIEGIANGNAVQGNFIGTDVTGTLPLGNSNEGITINNTEENIIGGDVIGSGNIISANFGNGIVLNGGSFNYVEGNHIGTDVTGTVSLGNRKNGIEVKARQIFIGGDSVNKRNVISGNSQNGILINGNFGATRIRGNYIGLNANGNAIIGNTGDGVNISFGSDVRIGGTNPTERNIISGNGGRGISIVSGTFTGNPIQGNYIGTDVTGTLDLGNLDDGIFISARNNTIGGTALGAGNLISGNSGSGIFISGSSVTGNVLKGNLIGTDASGAAALGNSNNGVRIANSPGNTIGGTEAGAANTIAFNGASGVLMYGTSAIRNSIRANSIFANTDLGIDLEADGVTTNDSGDPDTGANTLQNFPVLTSVQQGSTIIQGTLNSTPNTSFALDFYDNTNADASTYGEGQTYIGSTMVTTDAGGNATINVTFPMTATLGHYISATATDPNGNTSEFCQARQVTAPSAIELETFTAATTQRTDGRLFTQLAWRTGFEVDYLGFNVWREENGKRVCLNRELIAGSSLFSAAPLTSGRSYQWLDESASSGATYWLEEVSLDGSSRFYQAQDAGYKLLEAEPHLSQTLQELNTGDWQDTSAVVETTAPLAKQPAASTAMQTALASQASAKIVIKHEGWYRLTRDELAAIGFPVKIDSQLLQLFVDGREVPIFVSTDKDGLFDAIEFYGIGLDTPSTDARIYWLTVGSTQGKRIALTKGEGLTSATSFTQTVERHDRKIYFAALLNGERENFFGAVVAATLVEQSLTVKHIALTSSSDAVLEIALQGVTQTNHRVRVEWNGSTLGEIAFNNRVQGAAKFPVSHSSLQEGQNSVRLVALDGQTDVSLVDRIRLSYPHSYIAENDSLKCTATGGQQVTISGFRTNQVRVVDVTKPDAPQQLVSESKEKDKGYSVITAPAEKGERRLFAFANAEKVAGISLNRESKLREMAGADFLIITRRDFFDALQPLVTLRQKQGLSPLLIDIEDIYDEFNFGAKSPQAIKDFLKFASANWQKKPRFLLFAGDATYDARNYLGYGDFDIVPTKLIDTSYLETASDDWFSDFNNDGIADIATGRLPIRTASEVTNIVQKILRAEGSIKMENALLIADRNDGFDFESVNAEIKTLLPSHLKTSEIKRGELDDNAAKMLLLNELNRGVSLVNYAGHGSVDSLRGNLLTSNDADGLQNRGRLSLFVMMDCLNGYFHDVAVESLAEALLNNERGGAIAIWASSGLTMPQSQALLNRGFYHQLVSSGRALTLGEIAARAKSSIVDSDIRRSWILLGDPTIQIR